MNKKIQEMMKYSKVMNNKITHEYMQAELNVMFTQMQNNKVIKLFGERAISAMINELKQ